MNSFDGYQLFAAISVTVMVNGGLIALCIYHYKELKKLRKELK